MASILHDIPFSNDRMVFGVCHCSLYASDHHDIQKLINLNYSLTNKFLRLWNA